MDKICAYFVKPRKLQVLKGGGVCMCGDLNLLYLSEGWLESNNQWLWHQEKLRPVPKQSLVC